MHKATWQANLPKAWACPRCGARTRSGVPCRSPAMPNGRCRMHGGGSTGPSAEACKRMSETRMQHGRYARSVVELRRLLADDRRAYRELMREAGE